MPNLFVNCEGSLNSRRRHGLKGKTLAGTVSYAEGVTYIHRTNFRRHVGDDKSLHACAKRKMGRSTTSTAVPSGSSQKRVDTCLNNASNRHTILFNTILTMIMEDMALLKIDALVEMQRRNGLSISESKVNNKAAREMVSCLAEVVTNLVSRKIKESKFISLACDGSEARKTRDEKELVYCKIVCDGDFGVATPVFIFACQSAKDFGGANADGVFAAMKSACLEYMSQEELKLKLVCIVADGAAVNFGRRSGALTQWLEWVGRFLLLIHCMNHRLELAMNNSFKRINVFTQIKEMIGQLFRMFKNSGKLWRVFRVIAEPIGVLITRFVKADGTRFQQHVYDAMNSFTQFFGAVVVYRECNGNEEVTHKRNGTAIDRVSQKMGDI